jgi:urease accessory protein UreF
MQSQTQIMTAPAVEPAADLGPLLEQMGSPDALTGLRDALELRPVTTLGELRRFLRGYQERILRPIELPAIYEAFGHASRQEARELVALDARLGREPLLNHFANASRRAGLAQLERLRPLRGERTAQRYLMAVEEGAAQGWHTLVFGLMLAIYSRPPRQWLLGYAQETTRGFIRSAARSLEISKEDAGGLFEELCEGLPAAVEPLLESGIKASV